MPNPIEMLLDPVNLTILGFYACVFVWETLFPGRPLPKIPYWNLRGLVAFVVFFLLSSYLPLFWDQYLSRFQLLDLSHKGIWGGAAIGLLVYELGAYLWHRSMHRSNLLWRVLHQMHHSSERLDAASAFYFSPFDMVGWTLLGSICFALVIGLSPGASTAALLIINFLAIFQHSNIRTPRWLGYIVQRPESHSVHHARGIHAFNYSDLPVFDMLFGSFRNPKYFASETGFYNGASSRVWEMLTFRKVDEPPRSKTLPRLPKRTFRKAV